MDVLDEIVQWSQDRPAWQRDALRRLAGPGELTESDFRELVELCLGPHREDAEKRTATPLTSEHLQEPGQEVSPTHLLEVSDVKNVNALVSGSSLPVSSSGLTVVYGANGAGKTGYVRILRQVCRARGESPPVLPNVFEEQDDEVPAKAKIHYKVGETKRGFDWIEGAETVAPLQAVSIFDRKSASVYVSGRQEVAYLPYGLDLLPRLADVCGVVRDRLEQRIQSLHEEAITPPEVPEDTRAAELVAELHQEDAKERLDELADLSEEDEDRLAELNRQLSADAPKERAAELRGRSDRIAELGNQLYEVMEAISSEAVQQLRQRYEALETAREAAELASEEAFGDEPLEGTGSDPWRRLWQAARRFSKEVARQNQPYPPREGQPCLLCQRDLSQEAADRMARFEDYVQSEVEDQVSEAKSEVEEAESEIDELSSPSVDGVITDLEMEDEDLVGEARQAADDVEDRLQAIKGAQTTNDLASLPSSPDPEIPISLVHQAVLVRRRSRQQASAAKDEERKKMEDERKELEGREVLASRRQDLTEEIDRLKEIRALEQAKDDTDTTAITLRSKRLTREAVTGVIASSFEKEIEELRLDHLPIQVAGSRGERGTAYHRTKLEAPERSEPGGVLSRGEHRCVALAAFLAELSVQDSHSTVVLDDPVSSLDHDRREYVAERLVEVASDRPVVVFTHDLVFLFALNRLSDALGVELNALRLERSPEAVGKVVDNLPWAGMTLKQRIGKLKQLQQQAGATFRDGREDEYESQAREIYGYLREAWERGVEEILLNRAVERFDRAVETRRLRSLPRIEQQHIEAVNDGMSKASKYLRGHDDAVPTMDPVPEPDELMEDIERLDEWRLTVQDLHR